MGAPRCLRSVMCPIVTLLPVAACVGPRTRVARLADKPSPAAEVFKKIDPTGAAQRNIQLGEAGEAIKKRLDELDVAGINEAVAEIRALAEQANIQITALLQEVHDTLTTRLDEAQLAQLSTKLQDLADESSSVLADLDPDAVNRAVADVRRMVNEIAERVRVLDIAAGNQVLTDAAALRPEISGAIEETTRLVRDLRQKIDVLPMVGLNENVERINAAAESIERAFTVLWFVLVLATVPIALAAVCAAVWLRRRTAA